MNFDGRRRGGQMRLGCHGNSSSWLLSVELFILGGKEARCLWAAKAFKSKIDFPGIPESARIKSIPCVSDGEQPREGIKYSGFAGVPGPRSLPRRGVCDTPKMINSPDPDDESFSH